jgi:hypothetical protein
MREISALERRAILKIAGGSRFARVADRSDDQRRAPTPEGFALGNAPCCHGLTILINDPERSPLGRFAGIFFPRNVLRGSAGRVESRKRQGLQ